MDLNPDLCRAIEASIIESKMKNSYIEKLQCYALNRFAEEHHALNSFNERVAATKIQAAGSVRSTEC
jgi:hypothetical protein